MTRPPSPSDPAPETRRILTDERAAGDRLDRYLAARLDEPRNQVQRWIRDGCVRIGDTVETRPSTRLEGGERIRVRPPPPEPAGIEPEPGSLTVLHEDPMVVVVDKPAGLTVHPGAGRPAGTLVHRLLARYPELDGVGGPRRPGIVHRLDKDTSGVLVVARTAAAYRALQRAFAQRAVEKRYLTVVYGTPDPAAGTIDRPVGRHPAERKRMTTRPDGRAAVTHYRTLATGPGVALLEIDLATGRTHQIRVHLKAIHHPIVGDPIYGEARWKEVPPAARSVLRAFPRPALHAWRLAFEHPGTGARIEVEAPVPEDMRRLLEELGIDGPEDGRSLRSHPAG
ncbi:MAG: RluA family pseudouridine synthase [Acidobacteriota bacterium]